MGLCKPANVAVVKRASVHACMNNAPKHLVAVLSPPSTHLPGVQVKLILAPNAMHCLWGGAMRDACPGALLVGPPNAAKRHASLGWDATISSSEEFEAVLRKATGSKNDIRAWTTADGGWSQ